MNESRLVEFAARYTAAWCSHSASTVATFYSEAGSLRINGGAPAVGRKAVTMPRGVSSRRTLTLA